MPNDNKTPHLPEEYDAQVRSTIPYYDSIHEETINLVRALEPPRLWLDTGCGTGSMVERALGLFPNTRLIAVDPSESMLRMARKRLEGKEKVLILGPASTQQLSDLIDERPDVITAVQCHHYLSRDERGKAVEACFGLLSENGTFITFENIRPFSRTGIEVGKRNWGRFQRDKGKSTEDVESHLSRFDHEYFPITVEEHLNLLRKVGFSVVELLWYSYMQAGFYCMKGTPPSFCNSNWS